MPMYAVLGRFTQEGIDHLGENIGVGRQAAGELRERLGIKQVAALFTMGQYDIVNILEAPDDETMTKYTVSISKRGRFRTETLRGYSVEEWTDLIRQLP